MSGISDLPPLGDMECTKVLKITSQIPGVICRGRFGSSPVILKRYNCEKMKTQKEFIEAVESITLEVYRIRLCRHPNIVSLVTASVQESSVVLVFPEQSLGSVGDLIDAGGRFPHGLPEPAVAIIVRDVLLALQYLHEKNIVHRSVKCSHILVSGSGSPCKLTGLRYSCSLVESGSTIQDRYDYPEHVAKENLLWLSPEFLQQNLLGYNEKTDIYSLGVTACEAANGIVPFAEMPTTLMFLEKLRGVMPVLYDSTTTQQLQVQQQQQQQQQMMEEEQQAGVDQLAQFPSNQPGDSGVGASVGSCANVSSSTATVKSSLSLMESHRSRTLTSAFHSFVSECCRLDAAQRPAATDHLITAHPFIRQHLKAKLTLSAILDQKTSSSSSQSPPAPAAAQNIALEIEGLTLAAPMAEEKVEDESEQSDVAASGVVEWVF